MLQYNLDSIKYRHLVQALTFVYKGYPNYLGKKSRIQNYACNLRSNDSRLDQPASNASFIETQIFFVYCVPSMEQSTFASYVANLNHFVAKLKQLKLSQDECLCNFCSN